MQLEPMKQILWVFFAATSTLLSSGMSVYAFEDSDPLKILVIGAHPDDPETGAGGLMALASKAGHEVYSVYLTRGEAGIEGVGPDEAARIRTKEAEAACEIMGVRPVFLGQIDGSTVITNEWNDRVYQFLDEMDPDLVITHWPIDTHPDHRVCFSLVYHHWAWSGRAYGLYYMENMSGAQGMNFSPTDFVDIGSVLEQKHAACFVHVSQGVTREAYYADLLHGQMEIFRGMQFGVKYAEAFVHQHQSKVFDFKTILSPVNQAAPVGASE